jgi:hypothetical protein
MSEPLFHHIGVMQALDILDVEGAHLLFLRLEALTGSTESALAMAERPLQDVMDPSVLLFIEKVFYLHIRNEYCAIKEIFSNCNASPSSRMMRLFTAISLILATEESGINVCKDWINSLDALDCACLLQCWLFALMAKDVSVFITLVANNKQEIIFEEEDQDSFSLFWYISQHQECGKNGVLSGCKGGHTLVTIEYAMSVVDITPKPGSKISQKASEEEELCLHAEAMEKIFFS